MKFIGTLVLFIVILGSALAENKVEFHNDHDALDPHASEVTYHSDSHEKTSKKSGTKDDCDHYHVHCSNLCLGVLIPVKQQLPVPFSSVSEIHFNQSHLLAKNFSILLYRPPIA